MAIIVNGNKIATQILRRLAQQVKILKKKKIFPKLGIFLVGQDKPSLVYVKKKEEGCRSVGIDFILKKYPTNISKKKLINEIKKIQKKEKLSGLIVQLPLPKYLNGGEILAQIDSQIDVDYLTETNLGKLISGRYQEEPPTPGAILEILRYYRVKLVGKKVVLVGAGSLIGRPLANLLFFQQATVIVCNRSTKNLKELTKKADVLITGVGQYNLIRGSMVKKRVKVIDAGVCFHQGKMYGDINFKELKGKASLLTPTPGGVGPITVAKLIENVIKNAKNLATAALNLKNK